MSEHQKLTDQEIDSVAGGVTERPGGGTCTDRLKDNDVDDGNDFIPLSGGPVQ